MMMLVIRVDDDSDNNDDSCDDNVRFELKSKGRKSETLDPQWVEGFLCLRVLNGDLSTGGENVNKEYRSALDYVNAMTWIELLCINKCDNQKCQEFRLTV